MKIDFENIFLDYQSDSNVFRPEIFFLEKSKDELKLFTLHKKKRIFKVLDYFKEQQKELFAIDNPSIFYSKDFEFEFEKYYENLIGSSSGYEQGCWVYYPWNGSVIHIIDESDYQKVRTARNRYLIDEKDQLKFYNSVVAIAGLSIGQSIALCTVLQGGAKHIKLADSDRFDLTNMNRIRAGLENIRLLKTVMTAREIFSINPFSKIELFSDGLSKSNLDSFFDGADIVVDEIDDFSIKYLLREQAVKHNIPIISAIDCGDSSIVDLEIYNKNQLTKPNFFNGRLGDIVLRKLSNLDKSSVSKLISKIVGAENISQEMDISLQAVTKKLVSWPQLGGTALLNGVTVAYCIRKLMTSGNLQKKRYIIALDKIFK